MTTKYRLEFRTIFIVAIVLLWQTFAYGMLPKVSLKKLNE